MAAATALDRPAAAAAAAAAGAGARRQRGRASRAVHGEAAAAAAAPTGVLASVSEAGVVTVKLGRNAEAVAPRSAHAADLAYVEKLEAAVSAAAGNSCVHTVVLDLSAPDFMALGDHMSLAVARAEQVQAATTPHKSEPQLPPGAAQALLRAEASLAETWSGLCESKLCVAVLGDVVSSLGLALALPCALRVAAHSTVVQTPEALLGLPVRHGFASAACHTLGPEWSLYLALTGQPLPLRGAGESDPRDLLATGIATHLTPDESLEDLLSSLGTAQTDVDAREAVDALGFGLDDRDTPAGRLRATVEECFCGPQSITDVDSALQKHAESAEEDGAWAAASRDAMHLAPPAACAAIFAHIRGIVGAQRAARRVPPWPPTGPSPLASVAGALDAEYRLTLKLLAREDFLRAVSALGEDERCECSPAGLKAAISSIDVLGLTADRNDLPASGSSNASRPGSPESPYARRHAEQVARDWADSRYPGRPAAFTETRRAKVKKLTDALAEDGVNLDDSLKVEPLKRVRRIR